MIAELGHFSLILALGLTLLLTFIPSIGVFKNNSVLIRTAPALALGYCCFIWLAYLALTLGFINNDFSIAYVANNSNTALPIYLKISAVWGGHEGSLLLWVTFLSTWTAALALASNHWDAAFRARVLSVLGAVSVGLLLFILLTSNPFARLLPFFPTEGRDLNPLLQDFALIIHPPMLYMGYVGFAIAFALAIAALWEGKLDALWAKRALPWTLTAWLFLTLGIMLGSWWAYYELGWGGWWFWDPVENASLMPWLVGTALIHSLVVTAKRGLFRSWTALLAILSFALSLLGTFLVRSGVLTSVHAFANDPERGLFILGFLVIVVGSALTLFAYRSKLLRTENKFTLWSRESMLLANNIILIIACAIILLGTLYPLVLDFLNLGLISVGGPYFNTMFIPLFVVLIFLMGMAPVSHWRQDTFGGEDKRLLYVLAFSLLVGLCLYFYVPEQTSFFTVLGVTISVWLISATIQDLFYRWRYLPMRNWNSLSRSYYGMIIAHLGIATTALGITVTSTYSIERDVRMLPGDEISIHTYTIQFNGVEDITGPNYHGLAGKFSLEQNNHLIANMSPERRINNTQQMLTTKTAIDPGFFRDIYIALGEQRADNSWVVRIHYKPFVRWIWLGAIMMALGGFVAATQRWTTRKAGQA
jgi:cytochrome c-type biogenesis protein CcmF